MYSGARYSNRANDACAREQSQMRPGEERTREWPKGPSGAGYDKEHVHEKFPEKGREAKRGREAREQAPGEPSAVARDAFLKCGGVGLMRGGREFARKSTVAPRFRSFGPLAKIPVEYWDPNTPKY